MPILKQIDEARFKVAGTACFVSRYGLCLTAAHVVDDLVQGDALGDSFIAHKRGEQVFLRRIQQAWFTRPIDVALFQADNYHTQRPENPLMNRRARLMVNVPREGADLVTYAYPENKILDFSEDGNPVIQSDYYSGRLLRHVEANPFLPYPHIETSIEVRDGASGGPVFSDGYLIGVNSRSWDFRGGEFEGDNLSSVVPIMHLLAFSLYVSEVPHACWEFAQIPGNRRGIPLPVKELANYGHFDLTY